MAKIERVELIDDLTGEPADVSIPFSFDGFDYSIDLTKENADDMRAMFERYVDKAQRIGRTAGSRKPTLARTSSSELAKAERTAIREWAQAHGYRVSDRGRIPEDVVAAYYAAR